MRASERKVDGGREEEEEEEKKPVLGKSGLGLCHVPELYQSRGKVMLSFRHLTFCMHTNNTRTSKHTHCAYIR